MSAQLIVNNKIEEMLRAEIINLISASDDESANTVLKYIKDDNENNKSDIFDICESISSFDMANQDIFENITSIILNGNVGPDYTYCYYSNNSTRPRCCECEHNEDCAADLRCDVIPLDFMDSGTDGIACLFHEVFIKDKSLYGEVRYNEYDFAFEEFVNNFAPDNAELVYNFVKSKSEIKQKDIMVNHAQPLMFPEMFDESNWSTSLFGYGNNIVMYDSDSVAFDITKKNFLLGGK